MTPKATARGDVAIRAEPATFRVTDAPDAAHDTLSDALSYKIEGAEYSDAYRKHGWDGRDKLYSRADQSAPIGLLPRARDALEAEGYSVSVTDGRDAPGDSIETEWNFPHDLRNYQREAVDAVHDDGGGIVSIPTGGGKSAVALRAIHDLGRRAIVFVHSKELLRQWCEKVRSVLAVEPGKIGNGDWTEEQVTIASVQTLTERGTDDLGEYDLAIFDECHRTSAADTFHDVGQAVDAPLRIGLSATPWRKVTGEELKIEGAVGGEAYHVSPAELIDAGYLARPKWRVVDPAEYGEQFTADSSEEYDDAERRCIAECPARNRAIAETATDLASDGRTVLVSVDRTKHGERLTSLLMDAYEVPATFLQGSDGTERRDNVLDGFGPGDVLVSTLLREGVDLPELDAIVLASGGKSEVEIVQRIGRTLRPEGHDPAVIVDVRDRGKWFGDHFEERRHICREYYEKYGPGADPDVHAVREWLSDRAIPTDELRISLQASGEIRVVVDGWIDDFDRYLEVMGSTGAIRYDSGEQANYVPDPDALPEADDHE